jgi:hypothetical protein
MLWAPKEEPKAAARSTCQVLSQALQLDRDLDHAVPTEVFCWPSVQLVQLWEKRYMLYPLDQMVPKVVVSVCAVRKAHLA